jgi:hypothetical protein
MPRDLTALAKESNIQALPPLPKSTDNKNDFDESMSAEDEDQMLSELSIRNDKLDELHPYTQTLSMSDVESCVILENAAFPPNERASREKVSTTWYLSPLRALLFSLSCPTWHNVLLTCGR